MLYTTLKRFKPINPSLRHACLINKKIFWPGKKINKLSFFKHKLPGRNNKGHIILYTRSKLTRHKVLIVDSKFSNFNVPGVYCRFEYDSKRSSFIVLVHFQNGLFCYLNAILGVELGTVFQSYSFNKENDILSLKNGDRACVGNVPNTTIISNVESFYLSGSKYSRSAGTYCTIIRKYLNINKVLIKLRSGCLKLVSSVGKAFIGSNSNVEHKLISIGKAGRNRLFGIKPNVRGVAMNPVDHPHGGGEGKKSKKSSPRTPWGKMLKWVKTGRKSYNYKNEI